MCDSSLSTVNPHLERSARSIHPLVLLLRESEPQVGLFYSSPVVGNADHRRAELPDLTPVLPVVLSFREVEVLIPPSHGTGRQRRHPSQGRSRRGRGRRRRCSRRDPHEVGLRSGPSFGAGRDEGTTSEHREQERSHCCCSRGWHHGVLERRET